MRSTSFPISPRQSQTQKVGKDVRVEAIAPPSTQENLRVQKLNLKISQTIQGDFALGKINLLLIFQVNCPGCFAYALPQAIQLRDAYRDLVRVLALSTAFEDFALNTAENTRQLAETGKIVGMTQLFFQSLGICKFSLPPTFPLAFDLVGAGQEIFSQRDVDLLCSPDSELLQSSGIAPECLKPGVEQLLRAQSPAAYTFTMNQLRGTPSWLLCDERRNILAQWFGHKPAAEVRAIIDNALAMPRDRAAA